MTAVDAAAPVAPADLDRWVRRGLWALPLYGLLTFAGTLTHQPDPSTQFDRYARYISTDRFLAGHLVGSIFGSGIGIVALVALAAHLLRRGGPVRQTVAGLALGTVGLAMIESIFGAAAFAQPAIGAAALAGREGARAFDAAVYGTPLVVTALVGVVLFSAGTILLGRAVARTPALPRRSGVLLAAAGPLIAFVGLVIGEAQTLGSLLLLAAGVAIARGARDA